MSERQKGIKLIKNNRDSPLNHVYPIVACALLHFLSTSQLRPLGMWRLVRPNSCITFVLCVFEMGVVGL